MVHAPNGSLHFKQKRRVVAFVLLQLSACICNDAMMAIWVDLHKNGSKAPWRFVIAQAGINNEGIGPISS